MSSCIDSSKLDNALELSNHILFHTHLQNLSFSPLAKACPSSTNQVKLLKVSSPSLPSGINVLLMALQSLCITFLYIIDVSSSGISTYVGVSHECLSSVGIRILKDGLSSLDPTLSLEIIPDDILHCLLDDSLLRPSLYNAISCATFYPPSATLQNPFNQLIQSLPNAHYTIICIAEPMTFTSALCLQTEIQKLSTCLHPFREISHSSTCTDNDSTTDSSSHSHNVNENTSCSNNSGSSLTHTQNQSCTDNQSLTLKVTDPLTLSTSASSTHSEGDTTNNTANQSNTSSNLFSCTKSTSDSQSITKIHSHTTTFRQFNQEVERLLLECTRLLDFHRDILVPPIFQFATYFLAPSIATSVRAASTYMYPFTKNKASNFPSFINTWSKDMPSFNQVFHYLSCFSHPVFECSCLQDCITPTLPWGISSLSTLF